MSKRTTDAEYLGLKGAEIDLPLVQDLGFSCFHRAGFLSWHSHAGFELVLILEGSIAYEMDDGSRIELSGGEFFFNLPGRQHRGDRNINTPCKLLWIVFDPTLPQASRNTVFQPRDLVRIAAHCRDLAFQVLPFTPATGSLLHQFHEALAGETSSGLRAASLRSQLCQIILGTTHTPAAVKRLPECVESAIARMEARFADELHMGEIAAALGLTPARFYSIFRTATGQTPNDYLLRVRVKNAQALLGESERSITEIAFAVGFNSSQYFSKVFRKYTGEIPTAYRQHCC